MKHLHIITHLLKKMWKHCWIFRMLRWPSSSVMVTRSPRSRGRHRRPRLPSPAPRRRRRKPRLDGGPCPTSQRNPLRHLSRRGQKAERNFRVTIWEFFEVARLSRFDDWKLKSHTASHPLQAGSPLEHRPEEPDVPKAQVNVDGMILTNTHQHTCRKLRNGNATQF